MLGNLRFSVFWAFWKAFQSIFEGVQSILKAFQSIFKGSQSILKALQSILSLQKYKKTWAKFKKLFWNVMWPSVQSPR